MCVRGYDSSVKVKRRVNEPKEPRPRTSRSEDMIAQVEQMVMEDRCLTVKQVAANAGISVGSVYTILHDNLKMRKVSARWVLRMLADENKASRITMCQAMLSRDKGMNSAYFSSSQWMRHGCRCSIL